MGARFVRQPDGKLARWSDVVEAFTHYGMTREEALEVALEDVGRSEAEAKVQRGIDDEEPWKVGVKGDGLARWRHCLECMPLNRAKVDTDAELRDMGFAEWIPRVDATRAEIEADRAGRAAP